MCSAGLQTRGVHGMGQPAGLVGLGWLQWLVTYFSCTCPYSPF